MKKNECISKYLAVALLAILWSSCQSMRNGKSDKVDIKVLNYGRSSTKLLYTEKNTEMPSGEKSTTDYKLNIIEATDTIKLYKDVQFGIEYFIKSSTTRLITLTTIWTFPSTMTNNEGKKFEKVEYQIDKYTNQYSYSNYTLEEPYEMLHGKWNVKILYKNKVLLDKNFYLLK